MAQTVVKDIPADKVDEAEQELWDAGATDVQRTQQSDGKFTLTATFAD